MSTLRAPRAFRETIDMDERVIRRDGLTHDAEVEAEPPGHLHLHFHQQDRSRKRARANPW